MMNIDILGTEYEIIQQSELENPKLINANGLCEFWAKKIVLDKRNPEAQDYENIEAFNKKVLRHEVIHAFFGESGLTQYMDDELLTDWLAS